MRYETERAETFFNKANDALDFEDKPSMFPARAMQHIYYKLLQKIKAENYDVMNKRIKVGKVEKVTISLGVWAKYNLVY
jgi:phytoene synthase